MYKKNLGIIDKEFQKETKMKRTYEQLLSNMKSEVRSLEEKSLKILEAK